MRSHIVPVSVGIVAFLVLALGGCSRWDPEQAQKEDVLVKATIAKFIKANAAIQTYFDNAYGYVVFPTVGKGGYIIGGGHGKGWVYAQNALVGYARITQITVGAQIGGQSYSEIIFFKDAPALALFKTGNLTFAAQATAVIVTEGTSIDHSYNEGVAVFTLPKAGAMAEASIGGQKFNYYPK